MKAYRHSATRFNRCILKPIHEIVKAFQNNPIDMQSFSAIL